MKRDCNHHSVPHSEEIAALISRYRASGLALKDFAREHDLPPGRLHYWLYQKHRAVSPGRLPRPSRPALSPVFQEVKLAACAPLISSWAAEVSMPRGMAVRFSAAALPGWIGAVVQGRCLADSDLAQMRQWLGAHPEWSRRRLSRELAAHWGWRNGAGRLKDMAARTLLVKLEQRGLIALPPRRQVPTNRMRCRSGRAACRHWDQRPLECGLAGLGALRLSEVSGVAAERGWVAAALDQFHYLGFGGPVGDYARMGIMLS